MTVLFIEDIIGKLRRGELRIPAFQRGFVWSPDDVAFLMDSIYKDFPFGSVLLWRTKHKLKQERSLGPFQVPEPTSDYPIDYVLDGQQRLTSILGVFATDLDRSSESLWKDVYFDIGAVTDPQQTRFLPLDKIQVDRDRHFPLNIIFDSASYRRATKNFPESTAEQLDDLKKRFQQAQFPYHLIETEDKSKIAIVFERINRKGIPLNTFQLLTAWTWSENFELKQEFEEFSGELEPFGFEALGDETDLLLRCAAGILLGKESAESLLSITGSDVREALPRIKHAVRRSIDFLRNEFKITKLSNLPYPTMLIPLAAFFQGSQNEHFSADENQVKYLRRWFWRTAFSYRYSSGTKRSIETDISAAKALRKNEKYVLGDFSAYASPFHFLKNEFKSSSVDTKTFILLLLSQNPKSIVNGTIISQEKVLASANRSEFHHIFPQKTLKGKKGRFSANSLMNFCLLSSADNKRLGGESPADYKNKLCSDLSNALSSNLIPDSVFNQTYDLFIVERAKLFVELANQIMENSDTSRSEFEFTFLNRTWTPGMTD